MKESVTKFDFEAAFKALDEIDVPSSNEGVKANRPALAEIFSRKSKFDSLFEEYYDIGSSEELGDAKEAREAEIAKAKLERIEKIVDLDADSPEDLLTSYVGKYIIQCPQCMTLFYKDKEDVVESEDDSTTVNVNEVCQHCGNESGYTLIGKVGEAEADEAEAGLGMDEMPADEELPTEEVPEEGTDEATEAPVEGDEDFSDLDALDLDLEEPVEDEEKKEESFVAHAGETLVEDVQDDKELDAKLEAHNEYIEYLRTAIAQEEKELEKTNNEQVKDAIQRRIDAFKADLESALPDAVKNDVPVEEPEELVVEEPVEDTVTKEESYVMTAGGKLTEELKEANSSVSDKVLHDGTINYIKARIRAEEQALEHAKSNGYEAQVIDSIQKRIDDLKKDLDTALSEELHEDADIEVSAEEFEKLINEPEFKKPISDAAVRAMLNSDKEAEEKDTVVKESKSIYHCDDCGYAVELEDEEYDGMCPRCHEHHGFYKLEEGIFDNIKNAFGKAKDGIAKFIDNKIKSRASAADFILKNALKDYTKATINDKGEIETPDDNKKFKTFAVAYFTNKFNDGAEIKQAPALSDIQKLVKGKDSEAKVAYTDAENIAKGWSKIADNGPAIIFMANGASDDAAELLCVYFNGDLAKKSDQLAKQLEKVKNGLAGAKSMAKGNSGQADTKQVKANELKKGMQLTTKNKGTAEVVEIAEGDVADLKITYKLQDGSTVSQEVAASQVFNILVLPTNTAATESLNTVMNNIEELNESVLEKLISDSLVEAYGNVAGYRLTGCEYLDESFKINGTIYFTSGKSRNTTYAFAEAYSEKGKVKLNGLNEKLGLDKKFTLTGRIENKTLITESFSNK